MRSNRIRATGEAMPKDSVLENHVSERTRRRTRTSGKATPDAPSVSGADARDDDRAIPPAESMEKIMNKRVKSQSAPVCGRAADAYADLGFDMSELTILELVTAFEGLQTISSVLCGILGQPRCGGAIETLFDDFWRRVNFEWAKAVDEIVARVPGNRAEKEARDYAIVANSIDQNSPIDLCLVDARSRIDRRPVREQMADQDWEQAEREAVRENVIENDNSDDNRSIQRGYDLNDLESDANHLYELIDTIMDSILDCEFVHNGKRDAKLDRVSALTWVARDLAHTLVQHIDKDAVVIGSTFSRKNAA